MRLRSERLLLRAWEMCCVSLFLRTGSVHFFLYFFPVLGVSGWWRQTLPEKSAPEAGRMRWMSWDAEGEHCPEESGPDVWSMHVWPNRSAAEGFSTLSLLSIFIVFSYIILITEVRGGLAENTTQKDENPIFQ